MPVDFLTEDQAQRYGRYTGDPTPEQLARYFYLDDADQERIRARRGDHTRLGFALQLSTVRFLGTFLEDPTAVPPRVVAHLAAQVHVPDPMACLDRYRTGTVRWEHTAEIRHAYGYRDFTDQPDYFQLLRWLFTRAWISNEHPTVLFDRATAWLVTRKILLPGVTVLERTVARIRDRANARVWRILFRHVPREQQARLEALLLVPEGERQTLLDRLRHGPTRPSGPGLLDALSRLTDIRNLEISRILIPPVPSTRVTILARFATGARAQAIARMPTERRIATLLAFASTLEATAHDDVLDLLDSFITDVFATATRAGTKTRLRTLKDLDAAALQLATIGAMLLDPTFPDAEIRPAVLSVMSRDEITAAIERVADLARPPDDTYYDELHACYRRVSRIRPTLLRTISFAALPAGQAVLEAYQFLQHIELQSRPSMQDAPRRVINRQWRRYVIGNTTTVDRMAYTYCVLARLQDALRRREVYVTPSVRYADPRTGLLAGAAWDAARPQVCRTLGRTTDAPTELAILAQQLDRAYRTTVAELPTNTAVTITTVNGKPDLTLSPLEKLDEPASLTALRTLFTELLPQADLPEVLLEIHRRTRFADEFTHISETEARADDLAISLCAVLLAQACNIGLTPLVNPDIPALTRDRLLWVEQNYVRAETITRANAILVAAQNQLDLVRFWGGGEVASVDGMRFVVPIRTVHAGANTKYFRNERGVTYLNLTSNQFTGLNGLVATGTLRDSLVLISLLLGQQTSLHPTQIMTDTGSYADYIFGILWLLGYQFSPRISDAGGTRFWRIDRDADYGALNGLARHHINTKLIAEHWDDLLRLAGSLTLGGFHVESLMRTLQRGDTPTKLARALSELGRIIKTLFLLEFISDERYRRRVLTQLNRGETRHSVARAVFHGKRGELRQRYREGQEDQLGALGLVVNIIVLWNTIYMDQALKHVRAEGYALQDADIARLSPLGYEHLNFLGRYSFERDERIAQGAFSPLRIASTPWMEP